MRRFLAATMVTLAAAVLSMPQAAVAAPERTGCSAAADDWCFFPAPDDWQRVRSDFWSCPSCQTYGTQGVEDGRWPAYHCEGRPQGLDFFYDLYVPPTP